MFSVQSVLQVHKSVTPLTKREDNSRQKNMEAAKLIASAKIGRKKRRLLYIAWQTAFCLVLNVVVTILMSASLEDWAHSSDVWLRCLSTYKTHGDWDDYKVRSHLFEVALLIHMLCFLHLTQFADGQVVCREFANAFDGRACKRRFGCFYVSDYPVVSDASAYWNSELWAGLSGLFCEIEDDDPMLGRHITCECSCNDMISVDSPPVVTTALIIFGAVAGNGDRWIEHGFQVWACAPFKIGLSFLSPPISLRFNPRRKT